MLLSSIQAMDWDLGRGSRLMCHCHFSLYRRAKSVASIDSIPPNFQRERFEGRPEVNRKAIIERLASTSRRCRRENFDDIFTTLRNNNGRYNSPPHFIKSEFQVEKLDASDWTLGKESQTQSANFWIHESSSESSVAKCVIQIRIS